MRGPAYVTVDPLHRLPIGTRVLATETMEDDGFTVEKDETGFIVGHQLHSEWFYRVLFVSQIAFNETLEVQTWSVKPAHIRPSL